MNVIPIKDVSAHDIDRLLVEDKSSGDHRIHRSAFTDEALFELDNVELEFTPEALEAIADQAILRGTGARGLRAIMEEVLLSVMYDIPSRKDVARVVIGRETVLENVLPTLVPREASPPKRERREKTA